MAGLALASFDDLTARMGEGVDSTRARVALTDASNLIHAETNNVWISDGVLVADIPGIVLTICCKIAERVLSNPNGLTGETMGPFAEQYANSSNDVYLTRNERRLLQRAATGGGSSIGSITLESPYPMRPALTDVYTVFDNPDTEYFPMGPFPSSA